MASTVFFIQHILVTVERFLVELMTINKKESPQLSSCKAQHDRTVRPVVPFLHTTSDVSIFKVFFLFVAVRSFTADSSLLQPTGGVNTTPHTSHFLVQLHAHAWLKAQVVCLSCAHHLSWFILMRSCVCSDSLRLLHIPLFAHHFLSYHPVLPPAHQLHLPGCGGQISSALSLMRTLAPLPSTTLSQFMSPTTTTSRRRLNRTSRNPRSRMGPRMTSSTMTSPSAERSLHHCSPRSQKMMRAVDEPITFKNKVCRPVCRRPSVMIERGDPLWHRLTHKFQVFEKFRDTAQKVSKSGFFWNDKESRFSLTVKQRFENTNSRPIMTEEVFKSWMKWSSLKKKKFIVLIKETNDFDEVNNFFMNSYWSNIGIFVKLMIKASVRWKNWSDFKAQHSTQLRGEKVVEDRDTILELTAKIQELQNEVKCMNDSRDLKMLNQYAVDNPTLPVNQCLSHLIQFLKEC